MKPLALTAQVEEKLKNMFLSKFEKELEDYRLNMNDTKISFSFDFSAEAKEKITIVYSQNAYLRMRALVDYYDTEVGWYGLVSQINDKLYYVYDVRMCEQYVSGAKVDTDDEVTGAFFDSLTDDEIEHMHFQAHSHVKFSTNPSGVDLQNQANVIRNVGKKGFYIFQIWNKFDDINTFIYDMDNNVFYDRKDVIIEIEDPDHGTISDFIASTEDLVIEVKYPGSNNAANNSKVPEKRQEKEPAYLPSASGNDAKSNWEDFWE